MGLHTFYQIINLSQGLNEKEVMEDAIFQERRNKKKEKRKENKKFPYKRGGKFRCSAKEQLKKYLKNQERP